MITTKLFSVEHSSPEVVLAMVAAIVNIVPSDLRYATGTLVCPKLSSYDPPGTRWVFGSCIDQIIQPKSGHRVDMFETLITHTEMPVLVEFKKSPFAPCEVLSFEQIKKFADHFIHEGYWGMLRFVLSDEDWDICKCEITLPTKGSLMKNPRIEMSFDVRFRDMLKPILDICQELKLPELQPTEA